MKQWQKLCKSNMRMRFYKEIELPDMRRVALFRKNPELGPKILFFSGGSALKQLSRELINYTYNSIHVITPFDSGGSSAILRKAFNMPAIGDVRNRLMALADQSLHGNPETYALFSYRLQRDRSQQELSEELEEFVSGNHKLVADIPDPMRKIIRHHLAAFKELKRADFPLQGASIGNIVLTAGYLLNDRHLDPVIFIFSKLVEARGTVRPVISKDIHLVAELEDGTTIVGQHNITGKEVPPIQSPVSRLYLSADNETPRPVNVFIRKKMQKLIASAELICYPMGSFYSSICANLLPLGVAEAIAQNPCPKFYVPSTGTDPETIGLTIQDQIDRLLSILLTKVSDEKVSSLLNFVLVDSENAQYNGTIDSQKLKNKGIHIIDCPLISANLPTIIDENKLINILLSFC